MSEPIIVNPGPRKPGVPVKCSKCGHEWQHRGKNKFYICPECEKNEKGFIRGNHMKITKGLTMTVTGTDHIGPEDPTPGPQNQPEAGEDPGEEHFLRKILKRPILKI